MKNKKYLILGLIGLSGIGIYAYRQLVPPNFQIISYIPSEHKGRFIFAGIENSFGAFTGTTGGRGKWDLKQEINQDGSTTFTLLKNRVPYKDLGTY